VLQPRLPTSDGSLPVFHENLPRTNQDSYLPAVQELLEDPKFSAYEVLGLISKEIARLIQHIQEAGTQSPKRFKLSVYMVQIRILRALAASVRQAHKFRHKEDVLDLDGPKFSFVLDEILGCIRQSLRDVLGSAGESTIQSILMHLRDNLAEKEPEIRRELKGMG
jgi:hypothetical protein